MAFSLQNWIVPMSSGGSLTITGAPISATNATTGTVHVSWSGPTAGTTYLGAISNSDSSSVIAWTTITLTD